MTLHEWLMHCTGYSEALCQPWTANGLTVASDGTLMIMVPAIPEVSRGDGPNIEQWASEPESGSLISVDDLRAFCAVKAPPQCQGCGGDGKTFHKECHDCSGHRCDECGGDGVINAPEYRRVSGVGFDARLMLKILAGPLCVGNVWIKTPKREGCIFLFGDGWKAALMPVRNGTAGNAPEFFAEVA